MGLIRMDVATREKEKMKLLLMRALYSMLLFENNLLVYIAEAVMFYLISASFPLADGLVYVTGFLVLLLWRYFMYMVYDAVFDYLCAREDAVKEIRNS